MRATCGVMSARTPSSRPDSGSTTLNVCRSRSRAAAGQQRVEVLDQRRLHQAVAVARGNGRAARGAAPRCARPRPAGCPRCAREGASLRMVGASQTARRGRAAIDTRPTKRICPSGARSSLRKRLAPQPRRHERQQALDDQHQRERRPAANRARHRPSARPPAAPPAPWLPGAAAGLLEVAGRTRSSGRAPSRRCVLRKRRLVGLEAAVERVELGVRAVGLRVDRRRLGVALALDLLRLAGRRRRG